MKNTIPNDEKTLKQMDKALIHELRSRQKSPTGKTAFRNNKVAKLAKTSGTKKGFLALQDYLSECGAFDINFESVTWKDTDGEKRKLTIARAAATGMWPMGTHYWIRDNAIIGARLLFGPAGKSQKRGKEVLLSTLTVMSSVAQLKRFDQIIAADKKSFINNAGNWPHIFLGIDKNLTGLENEGWAHKQDAWQILAYYVLEGLENGSLSMSDLTEKHKRFLGTIIPFLAKVKYWQCENSGSWEEIAAVRTSVMVWDALLIYRLLLLSHEKGFEFLSANFNKKKKHLGAKFKSKNLGECASSIFVSGLKALSTALPFECPSYDKKDVRYRTADAALIYVLQLDFPRFLAHITGNSESWALSLERKILQQVESLFDKETGGIYRYETDSYQRIGYFRNLIVKKLSDMYGAPSGDASSKFAERSDIVPKGRKAAWSHFTWQLAAWAGRTFLQTGDEFYLTKHDFYFEQGLRLVTGTKEFSIEQDSKGVISIKKIPSGLMPECYLTEKDSTGKDFTFPTPHTPLNWAVVEMADAFFVRRMVVEVV
jgi:hypothetical protein